MTWVRTEALERKHPKMQAVPIAAYGFHHAARGWAVENRTNGFIPATALGYIYHSVTARQARKFAEILQNANDPARQDSSPLWEPTEDGWWIHDFLEYNESAAELEAKQEAARRRQRSRRHRQIYGDAHDCTKDGCHAVTHAAVTRGVTHTSRVSAEMSRVSSGLPIRTDPYRTVPTRSDPAQSAVSQRDGGVEATGHLEPIDQGSGSNNDRRDPKQYTTTMEIMQAVNVGDITQEQGSARLAELGKGPAR